MDNKRSFTYHYDDANKYWFLCFVAEGKHLMLELTTKKLPAAGVLKAFMTRWILSGVLPETPPGQWLHVRRK